MFNQILRVVTLRTMFSMLSKIPIWITTFHQAYAHKMYVKPWTWKGAFSWVSLLGFATIKRAYGDGGRTVISPNQKPVKDSAHMQTVTAPTLIL